MPFYRIIVFVKDRTELIEGVRELTESNIERAWQIFEEIKTTCHFVRNIIKNTIYLFMPFVRISLPEQLSPATQRIISKTIHQSLMTAFNIPEDDYFHVIEELKPAQLFYPESYLGIKHTKNIVYIQVIAGAGRTIEQKRMLYSKIATGISSTTEILISDIIIVLIENNGKENWSFGRGEIQVPQHLK
jgi:phenylpyruvate tautomerase PptA (4-oxalocrotonate tautomerase family)